MNFSVKGLEQVFMAELMQVSTEPMWSLTTTPKPILLVLEQIVASQLFITRGALGGLHLIFDLDVFKICPLFIALDDWNKS